MDLKKELKNERKDWNLLKKLKINEGTDIAKKIFFGVIHALIAYVLGEGQIFFGATPFGFAYLASSSKNVVYIYIGLCISAIFGKRNATVLICAYTIVVLLRILSRIVIDSNAAKIKERKMKLGEIIPMLFSEHPLLRMSSSAIGAFTVGIYTLISGGFFYYDLFGAIISLLFAPLLTLIYFGYFGELKLDKRVKFASLCIIFSSVVFSASSRSLSVLGIYVAAATAMALTLYFSQKKGIIEGVVVGMCTGLCVAPIMAPAFIFAAAISALLKKISGFFASFSASLVAFAWALFATGLDALTDTLPAFLLTALLFSAIDKLYLSPSATGEKTSETKIKKEKKKEGCQALDEYALEGEVLFDTEQRIKVLCETFSSLSNLFFGLSERMRYPRVADIKSICDAAFDSSCSRCDERCTCWEKEYAATLSAVGSLSTELMKKGHVDKEDVPEKLYSRCMVMPDILDRINKNSMLHTQQLLIGDKTEIFALDYEAVSELLASAMVEQREEFEPIPELTERLARKFNEKKFDLEGVVVFGSRGHRTVLIRGKEAHSLFSAAEKIRSLAEEVIGERLSALEKKNKGERPYISLTSAKKYRVEYAKRSVTAEGEEGFCGDTVNIFENSKDKFYSLISDGMGSGRDAALTSGISSVFLSKMLGSSAKCDVAIKMLGSFLRNKGSGSLHECSATVDLMELDLVTGNASFYKAGAAPSYVWREKNLFKLRSGSVPLGIIKEIDVRRISFDFGRDDVVVMVSDGVTQSKDECPWLFDLLMGAVGKESLASIADMIVKRAKYEGATDDISVVVLKICDA